MKCPACDRLIAAYNQKRNTRTLDAYLAHRDPDGGCLWWMQDKADMARFCADCGEPVFQHGPGAPKLRCDACRRERRRVRDRANPRKRTAA